MSIKQTELILFFTNASIMASSIFIPVLAKDLHATNFEIGIIVCLYNIAIFLSSYLFGRLSDMYGRTIFIKIGLLLASLFFFIQIFAESVLSLTIVRILAGFAIGIFPAALIAYVYESRGNLGKFSSFGSLGWAFGTLTTVFFALNIFQINLNFDFFALNFYNFIFISSAVMFAVGFVISLNLNEEIKNKIKIPFFPKNVIKKNFSLYISFLLRHTGANAVWLILPLFLLNLGADKFYVGMIYFVNSIAQFFIMQYIDKFEKFKNGAEMLISAGLILSVVVFFAYSLAQNFYQIFPIQIILALSWSCLYVGSLLFITNRNIEKATSIGVLNSIIAISAVSGAIIGGIVAEIYGINAVMFVGAGLSLTGFVVFMIRYDKK